MNFSLLQKIQVGIILVVVKAINLVDDLTSFVLSKMLSAGFRLSLVLLTVGYLSFVVFSYRTNYISDIAAGFVATQNSTTQTRSDVLGAKTKLKDFPVLASKIDFPQLSAHAVLVVDKTNKKVMYEKNSKNRYASASTTKLMTAIVALDVYSLDDVVTISQECSEIESTKASLPQGSAYTVESLLNAMLISSAGDAACALATGKMGQDEFVYRMNQKAYQLGMRNSYFTNPIGLDGLNSSHFSTAYDLYKLADTAMKFDVVKGIVSKKEYTIKSNDEKFIGKLGATNQLLYEIPNTIGVKTGTTAEAGQVLIYEYKDDEKDLLIVVMGSEDRFSDVRSLLNWLTASYRWS